LAVQAHSCPLARTHCSQSTVDIYCTTHAQDQLLSAAVDMHGDDWLAVLEVTMPERTTAELEDRRTELAAAKVRHCAIVHSILYSYTVLLTYLDSKVAGMLVHALYMAAVCVYSHTVAHNVLRSTAYSDVQHMACHNAAVYAS
jgi:hypothetical protein